MDKLFANMSNKVRVFSTGIKEEKFNKNPYLIAREGYEKFLEKKNAEEADKLNETKEKLMVQKNVIENINNNKIVESIIDRRANDLYKEAKTILFKDVIFEMFTKSLYLDTGFILENASSLKAFSDSYVDNKGGFSLLENAIKRTDSYLLKSIRSICEGVAKEVCNRKVKEAKDASDPELMSFDMTEYEKDKFDYKKAELSLDELTELVKKNVLTVIQDEKEKQSKEKELFDQIENELKDNEDIETEKDVKEALNKMIIRKSLVEETTLFNALMRNSYKDILESVVIRLNEKMRKDNTNKTKANIYVDDIDELDDLEDKVNVSVADLNKTHMLKNDDLDDDELDALLDNDDDFDDDEYDDECDDDDFDDDECEDVTVDMDIVLAEALSKYTMMELTNMIKLENFTASDVRKIVLDLIK